VLVYENVSANFPDLKSISGGAQLIAELGGRRFYFVQM
jgi:hypothetical protein